MGLDIMKKISNSLKCTFLDIQLEKAKQLQIEQLSDKKKAELIFRYRETYKKYTDFLTKERSYNFINELHENKLIPTTPLDMISEKLELENELKLIEDVLYEKYNVKSETIL